MIKRFKLIRFKRIEWVKVESEKKSKAYNSDILINTLVIRYNTKTGKERIIEHGYARQEEKKPVGI